MSESSSEDFLRTRGLNSTEQIQQLLGCLGCRWSNADQESEPPVHGYQIMQCTGIKPGVVYPILQRLENARVISSTWNHTEPGEGKSRREFRPAETELGRAFVASLVPTIFCPLEEPGLGPLSGQTQFFWWATKTSQLEK